MRVLVIGLGSIGLRHAKNLLRMGYEVFGIDPDPAALERAKAAGVVTGGLNIDACVIASPTLMHLPHLYDSLKVGWHTLVEKPLGDTVEPGLAAALEQAESVVMMGNNLRFNRCVQWVKNHMRWLGRPIWAYFNVSQYNSRYKDHVVLNWLAHECDLALYLLGPARVTSATGNHEICDMTLLHIISGCRATIHGDYLSLPHRRFFTIHGERAYINCDIEIGQAALFETGGSEAADTFIDHTLWPDQSYVDEMKEFIAAAEGNQPKIGATGRDGLETLILLQEARGRLNGS